MKISGITLAFCAALSCIRGFESAGTEKVPFECPPPDLIYPCTCTTFPRKMVKCDDVKNLDIVRKALEHRFAKPLPALQISNVHAFTLPHHALRNISTRKLVLNGSNFRRIHDDAFDGQDELGLLILSEDRLIDFPTEALKRLTGLRTLSLAGNFLMKITDRSIETLDNLRFLSMADNRLSQMERNALPRSLETLIISRNLLTTLNGTVNNLSKLEALFAANNRFTSVEDQLKGLSRLKMLSLDVNKISDIGNSFEDLTQLRSLSLAYNNLERVEGLEHLAKLKHLNLSYNYIRELDVDLFGKLRDIESLDLSGNYLRTICPVLKPLKSLRELHLSNANVYSLGDDCFEGMWSLQILDLSNNELTNIHAVSGHPFPKLLFLYLQNNRLMTLRHGFKNLKSLYELDISDNGLTTIKGHHLMHNNMLTSFKIGGNPWECTDHLIQVLRDLETRKISILGKPFCYLSENVL